MELAIKTSNVEMSNDITSQIKEKAQRVFSRVNDNVMAIRLTVKDINGPKGGNDKKCTVVVHCHGMPSVVASNNQPTIVAAVNLALTKAHASLVKRIKRNQANRPRFKKIQEDEVIENIREEYIAKAFE